MFALIAAAALVGADAADPIGPARQGYVQCYAPDTARKTCRSIGAYTVQPDGKVLNAATTLISASPVIVMQTTAPVEIKSGAICGKVTQADVDGASFTYEGKPLSEDQSAKLKQAIGSAMQSLFGHEICTAVVADGDTLKGQVSLDGTRKADMDQRVLWVKAGDYTVGP